MRIHGKTIKGPNVEIIAIPRSNGEDIIFQAQAVLSLEDFHAKAEEPVPPTVKYPDGTTKFETDDPKYKEKVVKYNKLRNDYIFIRSLEATPGLEWDTVNIDDPATWGNVFEELKNADLSETEIQRIYLGVIYANGLSDTKVEEARKRFLAGTAGTPKT